MALENAKLVSENKLEEVVGGLQKTNIWGDCTKYMIGMNGLGYAYIYDGTRDDEVNAILKKINLSDCKSEAEAERRKLDALLAVDGLLTKIPNCDPSWY